jgi:hypothetical protein
MAVAGTEARISRKLEHIDREITAGLLWRGWIVAGG